VKFSKSVLVNQAMRGSSTSMAKIKRDLNNYFSAIHFNILNANDRIFE
jgi:hypothetical protein